jgi:hypothetical protein
MSKYKLIVFTDPVEGREDEYNDWYNNQHLSDVVAVPGFGSAQRFKLKELRDGQFRHRYLAIYEIESDDYGKVMDALMSRAGTSAMLISEALDSPTADVAVFEACSQRVIASQSAR